MNQMPCEDQKIAIVFSLLFKALIQRRVRDKSNSRLRHPCHPPGYMPLTQRTAPSTSLQVEKRVVGGIELLCDVSRRGGSGGWYRWWTGPPFLPPFMAWLTPAYGPPSGTSPPELCGAASTAMLPHGSRTASSVREARLPGSTRWWYSPSQSQPEASLTSM
jgi:hypothetical protein